MISAELLNVWTDKSFRQVHTEHLLATDLCTVIKYSVKYMVSVIIFVSLLVAQSDACGMIFWKSNEHVVWPVSMNEGHQRVSEGHSTSPKKCGGP